MRPTATIQSISAPLGNPDLRDDDACQAAAAPVPRPVAQPPSAWARLRQALSGTKQLNATVSSAHPNLRAPLTPRAQPSPPKNTWQAWGRAKDQMKNPAANKI